MYNFGKKKFKDIHAHPTTIHLITFNRNQTFCATASLDGLITLWRVDEGEITSVGRLYEFKCKVLDMTMSRDQSNLLTAAGSDGKIIVYNMINKVVLRTLFHPEAFSVDRVLLSLYPIASILFYSQRDFQLYSYSINGQLLAVMKPQGSDISYLELASDGCFSDFMVRLD